MAPQSTQQWKCQVKRIPDVSHHQTLFFTDQDLEDSLQAREVILPKKSPLLSSSPFVYLENHDDPIKEIDAEIK